MTAWTSEKLIDVESIPSTDGSWGRHKTAGCPLESDLTSGSVPFNETTMNLMLSEPVRIKTRGRELSSGFEYNRLLFDLRIDPSRWDEFSSDVAKASRLNRNDKAAIVATIAGFSMLGLAGVGIVLGERVRTQRKLQRVMANREEGGVLAEVLDSWNENYFSHFGVQVWVEMSEAALRHRAKKAGELPRDSMRPDEKTSKLAFSKHSRKKIEEERKYMVVVSRLDKAVELEGSSMEPRELPASFGLVIESYSADLIDLTDDWSSLALTHASTLEDPFADPPDHSTSQLIL